MGGSRRADPGPGGGAGRSPEPRRVGEVLREALDQGSLRRGAQVGHLVRAWGDIVGPGLAEETSPGGLDGGDLVVVATSAPWAAQARFLAEEIRRGCNRVLGSEEVRSVRVVVGRVRR